jgi:phosphate transport system substrate-binding protein
MKPGTSIVGLTVAVVSPFLAGCAGVPRDGTIRYVGSSTIGKFMADAEASYGRCKFALWTEPESYGGEQAALMGIADIGGVARGVDPAVLEQGVVGTMIGKDAITVIVHGENPVKSLSIDQLKDIFTGKTRNWKELGGEDLQIQPYIVSRASATRNIFRSVVLKEERYQACVVVEPDAEMIHVVAQTRGAIGHISFAFLRACTEVKPLWVEGQKPSAWNPNYPITRPLYLCTKGRPRGEVKRFIDWTLSEAGQKVVTKHFVGLR